MEVLKRCNLCSDTKPISLFNNDKRTADGIRKCCISCEPPGPRSKSVCGKCNQPKEFGKGCKPCDQRRKNEYKERHADRVKAARSEYKKKKWKSGEVERTEKRKAKAELRPINMRLAKKRWKEKNKHKVIENTARRFASKLQATAPWADAVAMQQVYMLARFMSESTGIKWHVDHIVPLRGKNVCGLHIEHNLTFMPAAFNISKSNKFDDWA